MCSGARRGFRAKPVLPMLMRALISPATMGRAALKPPICAGPSKMPL